MSEPVPLTIVSGGSYQQREQCIARLLTEAQPPLHASRKAAVILEGLPAGAEALHASAQLNVQRVAPGCFCCIGSLTLRVTINRALKLKPAHLFLAVASGEHLANLRQILAQPPFNLLLLAGREISL